MWDVSGHDNCAQQRRRFEDLGFGWLDTLADMWYEEGNEKRPELFELSLTLLTTMLAYTQCGMNLDAHKQPVREGSPKHPFQGMMQKLIMEQGPWYDEELTVAWRDVCSQKV